MATRKTPWGEIFTVTGNQDITSQSGINLGGVYDNAGGDAGAQRIGTDFATINPNLTQASSQGAFRDIQGDLQGRLSEMMGINVDTHDELQGLFGQIQGVSGASTGFSWNPTQNDQDYYTPDFEKTATRYAQQRSQYDSLVDQFNTTYSKGKEASQAAAAAHQANLADLESRRAAAEAASRRNQAWAGNVNTQNRQNENIPETISAGTSSEGGSEGEGDVGGKPRRRRGALSSNLGINA